MQREGGPIGFDDDGAEGGPGVAHLVLGDRAGAEKGLHETARGAVQSGWFGGV